MEDMGQAGIEDALKRGIAVLEQRVVLKGLPAWLTELDFVKACSTANPWDVGAIVQTLRAAERQLRMRSAGRASSKAAKWELKEPAKDIPALPSWAADDQEAQKRMVVALGRLALGAAIEAALVEETLDRVAPEAARRRRPCDKAVPDAFLTALWSSAHAQYIAYVQDGVEEPRRPESAVCQTQQPSTISAISIMSLLSAPVPQGSGAVAPSDDALHKPRVAGLEHVVRQCHAKAAVKTSHQCDHHRAVRHASLPASPLRPPWNMRMRVMAVATCSGMETSETRS